MSAIIDLYVAEQLEILKKIFPEKSEKSLRSCIMKEVEKSKRNCDCSIFNNYRGNTVETDLESFLNIYIKTNPITTEHGVLFKQHDKSINLPAKLLEFLLDSRKRYKKLMFENKDNKELYNMYDLYQKITKIFANSWYGVSGQRQSIFFNLHVATSITGKGQSIITEALTIF